MENKTNLNHNTSNQHLDQAGVAVDAERLAVSSTHVDERIAERVAVRVAVEVVAEKAGRREVEDKDDKVEEGGEELEGISEEEDGEDGKDGDKDAENRLYR